MDRVTFNTRVPKSTSPPPSCQHRLASQAAGARPMRHETLAFAGVTQLGQREPRN
ncbi:hypothetical protein SPHINGOAX6_60005 [Sphingomonas sp. AX6]|nr:hypothetical protein SPHINGOAX6_60005 [Sphingomonas sp. AX6]